MHPVHSLDVSFIFNPNVNITALLCENHIWKTTNNFTMEEDIKFKKKERKKKYNCIKMIFCDGIVLADTGLGTNL